MEKGSVPLPSREALQALSDAINAVTPVVMLGVSWARHDGQVGILYVYHRGIGACSVAESAVPALLRPSASGTERLNLIPGPPEDVGVIEWYLNFAQARQVMSFATSANGAGPRLWVGLGEPASLPEGATRALEVVARERAATLATEVSPDIEHERLRRLELAAGLLPTLHRALDVREIFDALSDTSRRALDHDVLTLGLFNDDHTTITLYAQSGPSLEPAGVHPNPYPPAVSQAWIFDIIDERVTHPLERDRPPTRMGAKSSVRMSIQLNGRVVGGLGFNSFEPSKYTAADVEIGRRLADYVGVALSHQRLAEDAKRSDELKARAESLQLLDTLLAPVDEHADVRQMCDRLSDLTQRILPHDAICVAVVLPDGLHARMHAVRGYDPPLPDVMPVPAAFVKNPNWDSEIVDQTADRSEPHHQNMARQGLQSVLRVPVRLAGRFAGSLIFASKKPAAYTPHDILLARRIADRLAMTFSRDREVEAYRRADEASARAAKLESRVRALTDELDARTGFRRVVGESAGWRRVLTQATQVAPNETTVLLLGESGTGKEVIARFVHRASPRSGGPFIALNCAALPEQLLEAELFGYERGAYTGATQSKPGQLELAAGGTLFLDEVGEMSLTVQAKFLRVVQEREFQRLGGTRMLRTDARIVAATNRDLLRAIGQGQFREDLYYRLNVFPIRLPALRDRRDDIIPLCESFLTEIGRGLGRQPTGISRDARELLLGYHWPGNVRELRNILERASILCEGGLITAEHLSLDLVSSPPAPRLPDSPVPPAQDALPTTSRPASSDELKTLEREMIEQALSGARFNKSKAAKTLGLTRQQLYLRMKKYGLE